LLGLRSDIGNLLAGADLFVLPSLSEGLPLALLEAMLATRPIVATTVGEVPTVLNGGRAGVLVPPGDAAALAGAVADLLCDPARARRLGAAAALRAADEYTLDRMTERYVALYANLLARQPGVDSATARRPPECTARVARGPATRGDHV
jgi:glycosyltransferase involved in cell wall biosynthesis